MTQGIKKPNNWISFVQQIYEEEHDKNKNKNYTYKQAMQDASERKGEMSIVDKEKNGGKRTKRMGTKRRGKKGKKTMKRRK
jgi:hypothetical protein